MAEYVVLGRAKGRINGRPFSFSPSDIIDPETLGTTFAEMRDAGIALVEYVGGLQDEAIEAFRSGAKTIDKDSLVPVFVSFGLIDQGIRAGGITGPLTTTVGNVATWNDTTGMELANGPDIGTDVGDLVQLENVSGSAGLPAVDASQLLNVPSSGGGLPVLDSGVIPKSDGGGAYSASALTEEADRIVSTKAIQTPGGTVFLGPDLRLSNFAELLGVRNEVSNEQTFALSERVTVAEGSSLPEYLSLPPEETINDTTTATDTQTGPVAFVFPVTNPTRQEAIINAIRLDFDGALPSSIRVEIFQGTDDTGMLVQDETETSLSVGGDGLVELRTESPQKFFSDLTYFIRLTSPEAFTLRGENVPPFFPRLKLMGHPITREPIATRTQLTTGVQQGVQIAYDDPGETYEMRSLRDFEIVTGTKTIAATDNSKTFRHTGASSATWNLPPFADIFDGWFFIVQNSGGVITLDPDGSETIESQATIDLPQNSFAFVIYDGSMWRSLTLTTMAASFIAPTFTGLTTPNIASRIDTATSLVGSQLIRVTANEVNNLSGDVTLTINGITTHTVASSTLLEGSNDITTDISSGEWTQIITADANNLAFILSGTDTQGNAVTSNTHNVERRDLQQHEFVYDGLSSTNNPSTIDIGTMDSTEVTGAGQVIVISTGTTTAGQYYIVLVPSDRTPVTIVDDVLQQDVTDIFTRTQTVRVINANNYDSYVLGPLNAGGDESYTVTLS